MLPGVYLYLCLFVSVCIPHYICIPAICINIILSIQNQKHGLPKKNVAGPYTELELRKSQDDKKKKKKDKSSHPVSGTNPPPYLLITLKVYTAR